MQSLIALSTTKAEYITLSTVLSEVIALTHLLEELHTKQFNFPFPTPKVVCHTFKDNQSCVKIATNHQTWPRTKHLSVQLHHFRLHVSKTITIKHINAKSQIANMLTTLLPHKQFNVLCHKLMGWAICGPPITRE